ncbi:MAG: hypothetical protein E7066_09245 [Lentimicrobiaceae bacterium]|nr:hypothetical protein [Lentimicrobiaceae bacterium]
MNIDIKAPLSWNELSLSDLKHVAYVMMLPEIDRTHASILLFCKLAGLKMKKNIAGSVFFKKGKLKFILEPYQLMDFSQRFNYIFDEKPCDIVNPTKIDPHLIDVKFGDYYFANAMMMRYQFTGEKKFVRQALKTLGQRTIYLSKMKGQMIWIWWMGVQSYLQDLYPLVFPKGGDDSSDKTSYQILQDIYLMLNENRPQDNRHIADSELHSVLSVLQNKIEQYNREKEALKK